MGDPCPPAVHLLGQRLQELGWVRALWLGGSLATGDHVPGVSDLDLVALVQGPVGADRRETLTALHAALDGAAAAGLDLGCAYVEEAALQDPDARHPTWTHGTLVPRALSGISRAELVLHGSAVLGPSPADVLPGMDEDAVRVAARAELQGYWGWAVRRPWLWLDPVIADLSLTSMARGRHGLATGRLLTKTAAVEQVAGPAWLRHQVRDRRRGAQVRSPRLCTAIIAWRDARRTVARARRGSATI